jgi:quinol monooxygenase YgiN
MVELVLRLTAAPGRSHELVQALCPYGRRAGQSLGCRSAHLSADVEQADVYWYCEEWEARAAFEAKVRSEEFAVLLSIMETSVSEPVLEIRVVAESRSLDYVAALRRRAARGDLND